MRALELGGQYVFEDLVKDSISSLMGMELDKNILKKVLSDKLPQSILDKKLQFKVWKNSKSNLCIGWICIDDLYVSVKLKEIRENNTSQYILADI